MDLEEEFPNFQQPQTSRPRFGDEEFDESVHRRPQIIHETIDRPNMVNEVEHHTVNLTPQIEVEHHNVDLTPQIEDETLNIDEGALGLVGGNDDGVITHDIQKLANGQTDIKVVETRSESSYGRVKRSAMISILEKSPEIMDSLEGTIKKFQSLDTDRSGNLELIEVARIFGDLDQNSLDLAKQIILDLDINKDEVINPVEFDKDLEGML